MSTIKGHVDYGNGVGPAGRAVLPIRAPEPDPPSAIANTSDLRGALIEEIQALRKGSGDTDRAKAIAGLAKGIIDLVRLDLEYARLHADGAASSVKLIGGPDAG